MPCRKHERTLGSAKLWLRAIAIQSGYDDYLNTDPNPLLPQEEWPLDFSGVDERLPTLANEKALLHLDRDYTASIDSHTSSEPGNPHLGPRTDTLLSLGLDYTASSFDGQGSLDLGPTNLYPFDFDFADVGSCNPSIVSNGFLPQINDFSSGYTSSLSFPDAFDDLSDLLPKPPTHSLWPQESPGDGPQEQVTSPEFSASISLISPFSPQNSPEIPEIGRAHV